jgi:heavy metal efflux system protein
MAAVKSGVTVPEGSFLRWGGEFENQQRALARLAVIVPISFLAVFALLYTALGSVWSALTVLLVAPLAMSGGVFGLAVAAIPLSVSAAVGFIALLGQVCLASLLVVSAVDDRRRQGDDLTTALSQGAASRFRAVLMTAMLAILGLMPMAVSTGVGSETERPFAVVIISGLVTAIAVTLLVLPPAYRLIAGKAKIVDDDVDYEHDFEEIATHPERPAQTEGGKEGPTT